MLYPTGENYFCCGDFIGRLKGEFNPDKPYQTYTIFNPISSKSLTVAAMHLLPIDELIAVSKLNDLAGGTAEKQKREQHNGGEQQNFRYWSHAALAAQVIAYLTNQSILLERDPTKKIGWSVYSDVDFEAALFILRFREEPPPVKPEWWDRAAAAARRFRDKEFDDRPWLASISSKFYYYRLPGSAPALGDHPNDWATELNDQFEAAKALKEIAQEELTNDPLHQEDMHQAARDAFIDSLVDEEFGMDDYHEALGEWDRRNNEAIR